jgi:hypothetical protein
MANALKSLLLTRHLHAYSAFAAEYVRHAKQLNLPQHAPTKTQYYRWVAGDVQNLPRGYHCMVLEHMFPGWTAKELFGSDDRQEAPEAVEGDLLASISPAVEPGLLAGLWVTGYVFEGTRHHVDLSTVTATDSGLASRNYPPQPRAEGHPSGHITDIGARLVGRHVMGVWRNRNDRYYFGSLHLVVLPGESILDGYYTGFLSDAAILAERWRWVRVEPGSAVGVDLASVTVGEPRQLYETLAGRTAFDGPIPLTEVTEDL